MKITQQEVVQAFRAMTIEEQRVFFRAVSADMEFPTVVRDVAAQAAGELEDYMDFHGVAFSR